MLTAASKSLPHARVCTVIVLVVDVLVREAHGRHDMWEVMHLLATRCLVASDWEIVADLWRFFHSVVEQVRLIHCGVVWCGVV